MRYNKRLTWEGKKEMYSSTVKVDFTEIIMMTTAEGNPTLKKNKQRHYQQIKTTSTLGQN